MVMRKQPADKEEIKEDGDEWRETAAVEELVQVGWRYKSSE